MACIARALMSSGAGKSGKPCERLTAPCLKASRVISRMTDSVKRLALLETWLRRNGAIDVIMLQAFKGILLEAIWKNLFQPRERLAEGSQTCNVWNQSSDTVSRIGD